MKKLFLIPLIFLPLIVFSRQLNINISHLSTVYSGKSNYTVTTGIVLDERLNDILDEKIVKIPVERFIFKGSISDNIVKEEDFLYSQFPLDLNNNGSFSERYPVTRKMGKLHINNRSFSLYLSKRSFEKFSIFDNTFLEQKLTEKGLPMVLYEDNIRTETITVGAGSKNHPLSIGNFPNPSLQLIVAAKVDSIRKKPLFRIEGKKNFITYTNENIFEDQADSWVALVWTIIPLRSDGKLKKKIIITSTIKDIKPPFMVAVSLNLAVSSDTRLQSRKKIFRVFDKTKH